ncbi:MAG TPA: lipase maturation factor family protein, partial [Candidatus Eisenbacteria bacterium]|nr:lipase maturation factor family protein [Candidatus Eisenbacteria bacterium]
TALTFHYETQPLPTWIGWYAHQLPASIQKLSTFLMFGIELVIPFLIFAPRRIRFCAGFGFVALQLMILLTGNYCFFNLLTMVLCISLLDDATLARVFPKRWRNPEDVKKDKPEKKRWDWPLVVTIPLAGVVIVFTLMQFSIMFRMPLPWPRPLIALYGWVSPFRSFSSYGLFAVMTTTRPEITLEGSNDGVSWREYEFKYKAGDVKRRPEFVEPHQPRLDWQMWFAALGDYRQNPWFLNFCVRLLQGSPDVLGLLGRNPFPDAPPRYVRALVYEYHFTDFETRRKTGAWWHRELKGDYIPVISLRQNE